MAFPGIIAFINPRSGGHHGSKLYVKLCIILGKDHVFDLTQGGPEPGLRKFRKHIGLRVIACGGDGTVGWVHSCIDRIRFADPPMVVPFPLGTGNDMSRVLGWGANYAGEAVVPLLETIAVGAPVKMDRWTVSSDPLEGEDFELLHDKMIAMKVDLSESLPIEVEAPTLETSNDADRMTQSEEVRRGISLSSSTSESVSPSSRLSASSSPGSSSRVNTTTNRAGSSNQLQIPSAPSPATEGLHTATTPPPPLSTSPSVTPPPAWIDSSSRKIRFHEAVFNLPVRSATIDDDLAAAEAEKTKTPDTKSSNALALNKANDALAKPAEEDAAADGTEETPTTPQLLTPPAKRLRRSTATSSDASLSTAQQQQSLSTGSRPSSPISSEEVPEIENGVADVVATNAQAPAAAPSENIVLSPRPKQKRTKRSKSRSKGSDAIESQIPEMEEALANDDTIAAIISTAQPSVDELMVLEAQVDAALEEMKEKGKRKKRSKMKTDLSASVQLPSASSEQDEQVPKKNKKSKKSSTPRAETEAAEKPPKPEKPKRDELYEVRERLGRRLAQSDGASMLPKQQKEKVSEREEECDESGNEELIARFGARGYREDSPGASSSSDAERSEGGPESVLSAPAAASLTASSPSTSTSSQTPGSGKRYDAHATRQTLSSRDKLTSTFGMSAEAKTLVMNNYFSMGVDSMVALEFHHKRENSPSLFPHHLINKAWYGVFGLKHAILKKPDLSKLVRLALDGVEVCIPKGVEAIVFLQIPSYSSGTNVWGDSSKLKGQRSPPTVCDGVFEVVGLKGVLHLGALQAGWSSGIRLGQASHAVIHNLAVLPVQCDGEPWLMPPCRTVIDLRNQSTMLFNIAKSKPKAYISLTGHVPPSMVDPEPQAHDDIVEEFSDTPQPIAPTSISASELRDHIRGRSNSTGLLKSHEDLPARVHSSRKMVTPTRRPSIDTPTIETAAE